MSSFLKLAGCGSGTLLPLAKQNCACHLESEFNLPPSIFLLLNERLDKYCTLSNGF